MHHPIDRIAHTTTFVTPVVEHWLEREIVQWVVCSLCLYIHIRFKHAFLDILQLIELSVQDSVLVCCY